MAPQSALGAEEGQRGAETLVVDDGSTDATPALLAAMARKVPALRALQGGAAASQSARSGPGPAPGAARELGLAALFGLERRRMNPLTLLARPRPGLRCGAGA